MARVRDEAASKRKRVEGMETQLGKKEVSIAVQLTRPQTVEPKPWPTRRLGRPPAALGVRQGARDALLGSVGAQAGRHPEHRHDREGQGEVCHERVSRTLQPLRYRPVR